MFVLNNFWILLIWLFVFIVFFQFFGTKETYVLFDKEYIVWKKSGMLILLLPYILWAAYRDDSIGDTGAYRNRFNHAATSFEELKANFIAAEKEKGFQLFNDVIHIIIKDNDVLYFGIVAAIQLFLIFLILRKYSEDLWMSCFIFIASTAYISGVFNGLRQFLAASICFYSFEFLLKNKYIKTIILLLLAVTIHSSAIIMIPIFVIVQGKAWNKKTIIFICMAIAAIFFTSQFTNILGSAIENTSYQGATTSEIWLNDDGVSPIRVLINFVPVAIALYGRNVTKRYDDKIIDICINFSVINVGLYLVGMVTSGILIGRLPMYTCLFNYILLPWELNHIIKEEYRNMVKIALIVCYTIVFYYELF